jgi:tetratricopeptide (TPR) repeat protein
MASRGKLDISVNHCRNLPIHEDKAAIYFVKIECSERLLGESSRVEVKEGDTEADIDVTTSLEATGSAQSDLNDVINNPLVVSLLELLPKDKKAKEEKYNIVGQVAIDLAPVIMETMEVQRTFHLIPPTPQSQGDETELDIVLRVTNPFVPKADVNECNLLNVKVDSLYSVPSQWLPVGTGSFKFDVALSLPTSRATPLAISMSNGILRNNSSKDPESSSTHWKWSQLATTNAKLNCISDNPVEPCALEDEDGELTEKESHHFRFKAQKELPRVTWHMERRSWLSSSSCKGLIEQLSGSSTVPLEVVRMSVPVATGKGKGKEEDPVPSYHGVAYVDLSALLYPGVSRVRGAYPVHPYDEGEFSTKGSALPSHFGPICAKAQSLLSVPAKGKGASKRIGSVSKMSSTESQEVDGNVPANDTKDVGGEGQEYKESKSYFLIDISLSKPLVPRRPLNVLAQRVAEYITPRPAVPRRLGGAEKALLDYQNHISQIVTSFLAEYRDMFGVVSSSDQKPKDIEDRKRKFLFYLNSSGKYYAIKENLKRTIVKIVRENFPGKSASCHNTEELNLFIGELYTYLLDQMQSGIDQVLALENPPPKPPSFTTTELLKLAAYEAEVYCDCALSDHYHRQRLVEGDHVACHWYDYGVHHLHCKNYEKAEQCFKESLSLDSSHVPSLLAYSMCCALDERFDEGETFLEMATQQEPDNAVAWTISGLFFELCGKAINQQRSFREAYACGGYPGQKTIITLPVAPSDSQMHTAKHPLKNASSLGQSQVHTSKTAADTQSQVSVATVTVKPETVVSTVFEEGNETKDVSSIKSGAGFEQGLSLDSPQTKKSLADTSRVDSMRSEEVYFAKEGTNSDEEAKLPSSSVFLTTAEFLLDISLLKFAEMSLSHELDTSDGNPSPAYHIARARYSIQQADYDQAESSIKTAITSDVQNPNVWSTLGHIYYLSNQLADAQSAYVRALALVTNCSALHSVHLRLGDIYLKSEQFKPAKDVFLLACSDCPSAVTWRGVGIACYRVSFTVRVYVYVYIILIVFGSSFSQL